MAEPPQGFWSTLPGILTGFAAVITAATGLYIAVTNNHQPQAPDKKAENKDIGIDQDSDDPGESITRQMGNTASLNSVANDNTTTTRVKNLKPFAQTGPLVDCSQFPSVNTVSSLMSWSNYYHKQIISANGIKARAKDPCNKTIDYRAMAHCQAVNDASLRQPLLETLQLCRQAGIEWQDIQRTDLPAQ